MSISIETIKIANFQIEVLRKNIANMYLAVHPPTGSIRLSVPQQTAPEVVRLFAISKLGKIKQHIKSFAAQSRETPRTYVSGESHYIQGKRVLLHVIIEEKGKNRIEFNRVKRLDFYVKATTTRAQKATLMKEWYRSQLKKQIPVLLAKWEPIIGVQCHDWSIKQMSTKWGSCNIEAKRIWLNLELAKKPKTCLEYVIVHELVHLLERHHNDRFVFYMDTFMPKWRMHRNTLNSLPLAPYEGGY
ncbi:conserved hypothetical protein [Tenacibaculum maritimum]|uniref:M48 family metallopeptidase n=1 Tax=Tenacibaculum maritimum TaxID=107401 RepID=UPI0012E6E23D|nr:SprT family zinc-dependent metalloprotease [Tenacibaculum maritimum]CAA0156301.1 conserved hypothetical protein [Tenacibaculum maritimum]